MLRQEYEKYTDEDHEVWSILFQQQISFLPDIVSKSYLTGLKKCGFVKEKVPDFKFVNHALMEATGWRIYVVPGLIDNKPFFKHLAKREFPATTWLRSKSQLKYLEEPDMFHDVFGHVPLLSEPFFCDYLQGLSSLAFNYIDDPVIVELLARLYWYTVEFGLIEEDKKIKIYGAGIISSSGESKFSVSDQANHLPFHLETILDTPYIKDSFQSQYFVINGYKQLYDSLGDLEELILAKGNLLKKAS